MIIGKAISPFALRKKNGGAANDPDAQLFITATGISGTNATATNQLVVDLKAANIWTKMKAVYPMVGGTSTTCKFNLKNPVDSNAAYRLTFFGGGTFSANGYQPGGVNGYANTNLTPSNVFSTSLFPHQSFYSRTDSAIITDFLIGSYNTSGAFGGLYLSGRRNYSAYICDYPSTIVYREASLSGTFTTTGFNLGTQTGTNIKLFKNSSLIASNTATRINGAVITTLNTYIGALNQNGAATAYSDKQCAFASIGDGLTDAESLAFYNAVQTFNTTLGRQV